jgi:hypothetical protein
LSSDFLSHRKNVLDCIISFHSKIASSTPTLWLAVFIADQYIWENRCNLDDRKEQLIAASSILIASRIHDQNPINSHACSYRLKRSLTREEIEEFSDQLSSNRPIDPTIVTAIQQIDIYLQACFTHSFISQALEKYDISSELIRWLAHFHAERNLFDPFIAWQKPNLFAIGSLETAFITAFLYPTTPARSPSNSIDSTTPEIIACASSSQDPDDEFIPLDMMNGRTAFEGHFRFSTRASDVSVISSRTASDATLISSRTASDATWISSRTASDATGMSSRNTTRTASDASFIPDASFKSVRSESSDPKMCCLDEIIQLLSEMSGESVRLIHDSALIITKNVNSDFHLALHPASQQLEPNLFSPVAQATARGRRGGLSPILLAPTISVVRSQSETILHTSTPTPTTGAIPTRGRASSTGYIYGLKACQSILRDKYSQSRYLRVAEKVIPNFDPTFPPDTL